MSLYKRELKKNFSIPLYFQLKELLLQEIKSGNYDEYTSLPPETEIAEKFGISRPTVRQAICSLVNDGILTRTKGKGTYVIPPKAKEETMHQLNSNNEKLGFDANLPKTRTISSQKIIAPPEIAHILKITEGSQVFSLTCLQFAYDEPNTLVTSYIPCEVCPELLQHNLSHQPLHQVLSAVNVHIQKVKRVFTVQMPNQNDCQYLGITPDIPLFHIAATAYAQNEIPIELSFTKYRGDKNKFSLELKE